MPKFRGFRASLNFAAGKRISSEYSEDVSPISSVNGTYKSNREQFLGLGSYPDPPKKITPSMVKLPEAFQPDPTDPDVIKTSKSTSDLVATSNLASNLGKNTPKISSDPRGSVPNNQTFTDIRKSSKANEKEQKKLEKKKLAEQKKREKIEAQERAKEEKLQKEREKAELQEQAKQEKLKKERDKAAAQKPPKDKTKNEKNKKKPVPVTAANPLAQGSAARPSPYTTNTLDSSISKNSGPPPYSEVKPTTAVVQNESDNTGNTSFSKPVDSDSTWDMIAQHRVQVSRAPISGTAKIGGKKIGGTQKMVISLQNDDSTAVTGRKSLYV